MLSALSYNSFHPQGVSPFLHGWGKPCSHLLNNSFICQSPSLNVPCTSTPCQGWTIHPLIKNGRFPIKVRMSTLILKINIWQYWVHFSQAAAIYAPSVGLSSYPLVPTPAYYVPPLVNFQTFIRSACPFILIWVGELKLYLWQERDSLEHKSLLYSMVCCCQEVMKTIRTMTIKWMKHSFLSEKFHGGNDPWCFTLKNNILLEALWGITS